MNRPQQMSEKEFAQWEARVQQAARAFDYPPTPDIARAVRQRIEPQAPRRPRLAWAVAILVALVIFGAGLTVPEVRAAVLDVLRIGGITIFAPEPTGTSTTPLPGQTARPRSTERTPILLTSALDLPGETTLEDARARVSFPILLPGYPADLGEPEHVFVQHVGSRAMSEVVTLVWMAGGSNSETRVVLQILNLGAGGAKFHSTETVVVTDVNGEHAIWLTEVHTLSFIEEGTLGREIERRVSQNVLLWEQGSITYRLESDLSMDEAVRVAESLTPP